MVCRRWFIFQNLTKCQSPKSLKGSVTESFLLAHLWNTPTILIGPGSSGRSKVTCSDCFTSPIKGGNTLLTWRPAQTDKTLSGPSVSNRSELISAGVRQCHNVWECLRRSGILVSFVLFYFMLLYFLFYFIFWRSMDVSLCFMCSASLLLKLSSHLCFWACLDPERLCALPTGRGGAWKAPSPGPGSGWSWEEQHVTRFDSWG